MATLPVATIKSVYTLTSLPLSDWFKGLTASWTDSSYDNVAKAAERNAVVSRSKRIIVQLAAGIPLVIRKGEEEQDISAALALINRPNPRMTKRLFMDAIVSHLLYGGEVFVERRGPETGPNRGKAKQLYLHAPNRFNDFIRYDDRMPTGFLEKLTPETRANVVEDEIIGYYFYDDKGRRIPYTIDDIKHIHTYSPENQDRGLPMLLGAYRNVQTSEAAADWNKSIATGGGRVPGFWEPQGLENGQQLTDEQVEAAEQGLDERQKERKKVNLGMVLSGAFKWVSNTLSPKDAEWLEGLKYADRQIACQMGIMPELLGAENSGSLTDAGIDSNVKAALQLTVLPMLDLVLEELSLWLLPAFGNDLAYGYDLADVPAMQEDETQKVNRLVRACGGAYISRDEARTLHGGLEEKGGEFAEILTGIGMSAPSQRMPPSGDGLPASAERLIELTIGGGAIETAQNLNGK